MTKHSTSQTTQNQVRKFNVVTKLNYALDHLFAPLVEWQTRRKVSRTFAHLSNFHMQDIGLNKGDVEASCTAKLNQPVHEALKRLALGRVGNW